MSARLSDFNISTLAAGTTALFLDFDGTLAPIADDPAAVAVAESTRVTLARLEAALGGALAIISGRSIEDVDRLIASHRIAVAGVHGLMRRDASGRMHETAFDGVALDSLTRDLQAATEGMPGLLLEKKPGSVALHYRKRPELAQFCDEAVARAIAGRPNLTRLAGKMVIEVKAGARTKADAVDDFMGEAPFRGRVPLYAGDDVTDEDAFRAVRAMGGHTIRIGYGDTEAEYCADDTAEFLRWLARLSEVLAARAGDGMREAGRS